MYFKFKDNHTLEARKEEAIRIMNKYPERIPIICEKYDKKNLSVPTLDKTKYLVPMDLTVGQFYVCDEETHETVPRTSYISISKWYYSEF